MPQTGTWWRSLLVAALGGVLLLAVPLLNRQVFFFEDTYTYVHAPDVAVRMLTRDAVHTAWSDAGQSSAKAPRDTQGETHGDAPAGEAQTAQPDGDRTIIAGRSFYYGTFLYAAYWISDFWLAAICQAMLLSGLIWLLVVRCWQLGEARYLLLAALLSAGTSIGFYAGFMMPDAFTPALLLGCALLLFHWREVGGGGRALAIAAVLSAVLFHAGNLLLLAALLPPTAVLLYARRRRTPPHWAPLILLAGCVLLGIAGDAAFNTAVRTMTGSAPVRLPHLAARLVASGPGHDYLLRYCGTVDFALCRFTDRMPISLIQFIFSDDPATGIFMVADAPTRQRIADEQMRFALAVLQDQPGAVLSGLLLDGLRQLTLFGSDEMRFPERQLQYFDAWFPPELAASIRGAPVVRQAWIAEYFTIANYTSVLAALLGLGLLHRRLAARPASTGADRAQSQGTVIGFLLGAILLNGLLLGALATPYDRYQARVIWLVPMLGLSITLLALQDRRNARLQRDWPMKRPPKSPVRP